MENQFETETMNQTISLTLRTTDITDDIGDIIEASGGTLHGEDDSDNDFLHSKSFIFYNVQDIQPIESLLIRKGCWFRIASA